MNQVADDAHNSKKHKERNPTKEAMAEAIKVGEGAAPCMMTAGSFTGNETTGQGNTLLQLAVMHNRLRVVTMFIEKGADVDAQGIHGATALHFAAIRGNPLIVSALLEHRANADLQNANGMTPLNQVLMPGMKGNTETVQIAIALERVTDPVAWMGPMSKQQRRDMPKKGMSFSSAVGMLRDFTGEVELVTAYRIC